MFEMKYDKDGLPIPNKETEKVLAEEQTTPAFSAPVEEPEQQEVVEEVVNTESAPTLAETPVAEPTPEPVKEAPAAKSFRELREKLEKAEREKEDLLKYVIASQPKTTTPQQEPEEDLENTLEPDALAEGKHLSKVYKKIEKLERQLAQSQYQTAEARIEAQLKSEYPDLDNVINADNIELLKAQEPELAESLFAGTDLYKKAKAIYKTLKNLGIAKTDTPTRNLEREMIERNLKKPRPINSVSPQSGESPLHMANAFANGLTDDLKNQLLREMDDAIKKH